MKNTLQFFPTRCHLFPLPPLSVSWDTAGASSRKCVPFSQPSELRAWNMPSLMVLWGPANRNVEPQLLSQERSSRTVVIQAPRPVRQTARAPWCIQGGRFTPEGLAIFRLPCLPFY